MGVRVEVTLCLLSSGIGRRSDIPGLQMRRSGSRYQTQQWKNHFPNCPRAYGSADTPSHALFRLATRGLRATIPPSFIKFFFGRIGPRMWITGISIPECPAQKDRGHTQNQCSKALMKGGHKRSCTTGSGSHLGSGHSKGVEAKA